MESKPRISIREISAELEISQTSVWRLLRINLKMYPYKPKNVQPLTARHKTDRVSFSQWITQQPEGFTDKVIWSDEKLWQEKTKPNKQNERYWAVVDPMVEEECREQGGRKVMSWAGLINGQIILHWWPEGTTVDQEVYLEMLQTVVWPRVRGVATRNQYWMQQDGATCHTTVMVRDWLHSKFGERVISRFTAHSWPAKSPDLSPLDFWFWSVCLAELRRNPPISLEELQATVEEYSNSLDKDDIKKACRHIITRAEAFIKANGGDIEYYMKKANWSSEE